MKPIRLRHIDFLTGDNFIYEGKLPKRMLYLRDTVEGETSTGMNTAWQRLKQACSIQPLVFTDIYRSPASSADAYRRKTGVARPGSSGHNYGISVDLAVDATMKRCNLSYDELCDFMTSFGWIPYQGYKPIVDHKRGKEDWHFNFAGEFGKTCVGSTVVDSWIDKNIVFHSKPHEIQQMLKKLKLYQGEVDGSLGKLSKDAIQKFKKAWCPSLITNSELDEKTIRILNIVACDVYDENNNLII